MTVSTTFSVTVTGLSTTTVDLHYGLALDDFFDDDGLNDLLGNRNGPFDDNGLNDSIAFRLDNFFYFYSDDFFNHSRIAATGNRGQGGCDQPRHNYGPQFK